MTDLVNDYFKQFYPPQEVLSATEWENGMVGRVYRIPGYSNIFPAMVMADGLALSVQGHHGAYSWPRDDFADEYTMVEVMGPKNADELLAPFEREHNSVGDQMIYPAVPVSIIEQVVLKHGGLVSSPARSPVDERV